MPSALHDIVIEDSIDKFVDFFYKSTEQFRNAEQKECVEEKQTLKQLMNEYTGGQPSVAQLLKDLIDDEEIAQFIKWAKKRLVQLKLPYIFFNTDIGKQKFPQIVKMIRLEYKREQEYKYRQQQKLVDLLVRKDILPKHIARAVVYTFALQSRQDLIDKMPLIAKSSDLLLRDEEGQTHKLTDWNVWALQEFVPKLQRRIDFDKKWGLQGSNSLLHRIRAL